MRVVCVIPARYEAKRFPGKALAELAGKPLIRHVVERAWQVKDLDRVLVATDDERVRDAVEGFGGETVMTSKDLASGTDRVAAALQGKHADIVINLQGDEPLIDPTSIESLIRVLKMDKGIGMASLMCPIVLEERFRDPNCVKVVVSREGDALYFSRSPIPYGRDEESLMAFQHIGIYGFREETLNLFVSWPQGTLEKVEKLEQLRALENGVRIRMVRVETPTIGVDTPEDLERVQKLLAEDRFPLG